MLVAQAFLPVQTVAWAGDAAAPIRFQDVSAAAGMASRHRSTHPDKKIATTQPNFEQLYAKGYHWEIADLAFLDANGDGALDVVALNNPHGPWSRLWLGDGKGGFTEADPKLLACDTSFAKVLVCRLFEENVDTAVMTGSTGFYVAEGRNTTMFRRANAKGEPFRLTPEGLWVIGHTQLICDFDGDGVADLAGGVELDRGSPSRAGTLRCGTMTAGRWELEGSDIPLQVGTCAVAADFDGDGYADILSRGSFWPCKLLLNGGKAAPRRFRDATVGSGLESAPSGGPMAVADFNNDGRLDVFCAGSAAPGGESPRAGGMALLLNLGGGKFRNIPLKSGFNLPDGFAWPRRGTAVAADFDNDGRPEVLCCLGTCNRLYRVTVSRDGADATVADLTAEAGLPSSVASESVNAAGDYDGDGFVDALVVTPASGVGLLRNTTSNLPAVAGRNGWMKVEPIGPAGNLQAAGACVRVYRAGQLGQDAGLLGCQQVIVSTDTKPAWPLHFGLGSVASCDVRVSFPGGKIIDRPGVASGTRLVVRQQDPKPAETHRANSSTQP
jgi:hypothetical protein